MGFFIGLVLSVLGILIISKSEWMLNNFGRIGFFEAKLATSGGSRLGYKLVGFLFLFIGVLSITGLIGGFMEWMLSPLTRYYMPAQ